jgi:hypothetical protein
MHLQQTKTESRDTGGPQYYFHDLSEPVKLYLRKKGAVRVALVTPYGATKSDYFAVSAAHKLDPKFRPVKGSVGHDRIQQGKAAESIGEAIRLWYDLERGDFETIEVDLEIRDEVFYLAPLEIKFRHRTRKIELEKIHKPLSFTMDYASPLWREQINSVKKQDPAIIAWCFEEICRIVKDHLKESRVPHIQEPDLLRASGPLKHLGMQIGGYVGKGYDCLTQFKFLDYPAYSVPLEIKRDSAGFKYQQQKYGKDELSRAVVFARFMGTKPCPLILM